MLWEQLGFFKTLRYVTTQAALFQVLTFITAIARPSGRSCKFHSKQPFSSSQAARSWRAVDIENAMVPVQGPSEDSTHFFLKDKFFTKQRFFLVFLYTYIFAALPCFTHHFLFGTFSINRCHGGIQHGNASQASLVGQMGSHGPGRWDFKTRPVLRPSNGPLGWRLAAIATFHQRQPWLGWWFGNLEWWLGRLNCKDCFVWKSLFWKRNDAS